MSNDLRHSILATLAYFDIFDYPLTANEIARYIWQYPSDVSSNALPTTLQQLAAERRIETRHGYFFLHERSAIVPIRERAVREVEKKLAIAARACRKLRWTPFLQAVFVCNTVAAGHPESGSDIDVFIVIRSGRLWLARLLATLLLSLFGLRRHGEKITDRICLSFYATDTALDLSSIALKPITYNLQPLPDIYLAYWLSQLVPVYDPGNILKKIQGANVWAKHDIPHAFQPYALRAPLRVDDTTLSRGVKKLFEKMWGTQYGDLLESQAKGLQKARMKLNVRQRTDPPMAEKTSHVIVNDTMMKFHEHDRREEFRTQWIKTLHDTPYDT